MNFNRESNAAPVLTLVTSRGRAAVADRSFGEQELPNLTGRTGLRPHYLFRRQHPRHRSR